MWKSIFSWIILLPGFLMAQSEEELIENALKMDTLPKFRIRYVAANVNLMRVSESLINKPRNSIEWQGEVGIHQFALTADFGRETTRRTAYEMEGSYWRVGLDANLSAAWEEGNFIGLGFRYARATSTDQANISRVRADGTEQVIRLGNANMKTRWAELVFKMRGNLHKNIYTGYTMRYQFWENSTPYPEELRPFDIPGFGKTKRPNSFQFDYYIGWKFDFD